MNFREKASHVREQGVAERGNFQPSGAPLKVYNYWRKNSLLTPPKTETFCHYWRVVAIWAPLTFLRLTLTKWFANKTAAVAGLVTLLVGTVIACVLSGDVREVILTLLALAATVAAIIGATLVIGTWLENHWKRSWGIALGKFALGALVTAVVGLLVIGTIAWNYVFWLVILGSLAAVSAVAFAMIHFVDYLSGKRAIADKARRAARDARDNYFIEHGVWPEEETRAPGKVAKFFSGVGDFLIFTFQIVRVNKWKICPIVKIDA